MGQKDQLVFEIKAKLWRKLINDTKSCLYDWKEEKNLNESSFYVLDIKVIQIIMKNNCTYNGKSILTEGKPACCWLVFTKMDSYWVHHFNFDIYKNLKQQDDFYLLTEYIRNPPVQIWDLAYWFIPFLRHCNWNY